MASMDDGDAKRAFNEGGVAGLIKHANEKLDDWKKTQVNIAVVGGSGSGKSSFINTIRGVDDPDNTLYAKTGVVETTTEAASFEFPNNALIKMWDLPGAGTAQFNAAHYADQMHFLKYDAFVILSCDRFTEIDKMIANEIDKLKKPYYFARSKMDNVMRDEKRTKKKLFDRNQTKKEIKNNILQQLGGVDPEKIFLIANLPDDDDDLNNLFPDNDNARLKETIVQNLPNIQKKAIVFSIVADSEKMIKLKAEEISSRFKWLALASAAGGTIPIPGTSMLIDLGILVTEAFFQKKQLGIDDETINKRANKFGSDKGVLIQRIETNLKTDDKMSTIMKGILFVMRQGLAGQAAAMGTLLASQIAVSEAIETGALAIPLLGMLISGAISGSTTYCTLNMMLNAHSAVAQQCIKVFSEMASEMQK